MKKITLSLIILLFTSNLFSQTSSWEWATTTAGSGEELPNSIATDQSGNVFTVGRFNDPSITFADFTLNNNGVVSSFILKQDTDGNILWAKGLTGSTNSFTICQDICVDNEGNIYTIGSFGGTVDFGGTTLTANGYGDIYFIKYDTDGNIIWAKQSTNSYSSFGQKINIDNSGNIYIAGSFRGDYQGLTLGSITLTNPGNVSYDDIFIFKLTSSGNAVWGKKITGIGQKNLTAMTVDNFGNVYLTGDFFAPTMTVGNYTLTNNVSNNSTNDIYIIKYDSNGVESWVHSFGGSAYDYGSDIKFDNMSNIRAVGTFSNSSINFNGTTLLGNGSCANSYIINFDQDFNVLWGKSFGNASNNNSHCIEIDSQGNSFVAGDFVFSLDLGNFYLENVNPEGWADIYVITYDNQGNIIDANSAGGQDLEKVNAMTLDQNENIYVTGYYFSSTCTFGNYTITNTSVSGQADLFISKISYNNLAVNKVSSQSNVSIYPNPMNINAVIEFDEAQVNTMVKIIDLKGQEIRTYHLNGEKKIMIEKGEINSGIYFIQVITETNEIYSTRLTIE